MFARLANNRAFTRKHTLPQHVNTSYFRTPTPSPLGPGDEPPITWLPYSSTNLSYAYLATSPYTDVNYRQKEYAYRTEYLTYIAYDSQLPS